MKKVSLEEMANNAFLSNEQRALIEKLLNKNDGMADAARKLLVLHDAIIESAFSDPIKTTLRYLKSIEHSVTKAQEYIEEDTMDSINDGFDEDGNAQTTTLHRSIAVLVDKTNGIPERMANMQKIISGAAADLVEMVYLHGKYAPIAQVEEIRSLGGLSYTDLMAEKNRTNKKTSKR